MEFQRTIGDEVTISGISLHLGLESTLRFRPAPPDTGVVFVRTDLPGTPSIKASVDNAVFGALRETSIASHGVMMHTVEHVLASLAGLRIDNIRIESNAPELPAIDGSALPFVKALKSVGIVEQHAPRKEIEITEPILISEGNKELKLVPADSLEITYTFAVDNPLKISQTVHFKYSEEAFIREIAPARTFCFRYEIEHLKSQGLGKGGSEENVLVINNDGTTSRPLRLENEMARHKILDLIGDLYLLGAIPKAHILAIRSGHELNLKLTRKIVEFCRGKDKMGDTKTAEPLGINEIKNILPHRYPFLLVDRIIEWEEDKMAVGIKNVTINDYFFQGHFPDLPIMPGVLQIEALAQVAGILLFQNKKDNNSIGFFRSIDYAKFRRPVVPGDQLRLEVNLEKKKGGLAKFSGRALVDGQVVTEAQFTIAF